MELKQLYREIVNEHNLHPVHKKTIENPDLVLRGVNPSCGDDITLSLKLDGDIIVDGGYEGSGCAISQASVDMMVDQIVGKKKDEAIKLAGTFMGMIKGEITDEESIEALDEAAALQDVAHMPARVKCAVLGWKTMQQMLEGGAEE
ncbi:Fe-S cluster assembly sulfur transfer protein SufU [Butyrivibrio sp. AE2032]|jgi:nitrogen fixation NifU-like protein|uniref:Fe-S cluster assembly sulfur transfer protein SufU n=1 Tax=Butyrivibrio sp. AE2032 TaxID=1458463 RepID=UPI000550D52B|nr:SUF system NifU family Fe-S cluster assembly protein [Butyrivibrio sp. AE2032]